ncbi:MAG: NAD(P)H-binding protein [Pseudomonadota bacterium]
MSKILVTGASGDIGRKTLLHLLKKRPASELVGLVRDPAKAEDLAALGIELRQGDYLDNASLAAAFKGIEKLMLTSTHAFTPRNEAHGNVIDAATAAGVKHLIFMPIHRKAGSTFAMKEITDEDIFTIRKLKASGMAWTLAEHPPFMDVLGFYVGLKANETGVRVPVGAGKFAAATRDDLSAAHAAILVGRDHEGKSYNLAGDPAISFQDIAKILTKLTGKEVPYIAVSDDEYLKILAASGLPDFIPPFIQKWVHGMAAGEWQETAGDLEKLIGHKPTTAAEYFRDEYLPQAIASSP